MDERYAAIDVAGKGLVVFSAWVLHFYRASLLLLSCSSFSCSHAGIVNVIKDVLSVFHRPIYMVSIRPLIPTRVDVAQGSDK